MAENMENCVRSLLEKGKQNKWPLPKITIAKDNPDAACILTYNLEKNSAVTVALDSRYTGITATCLIASGNYQIIGKIEDIVPFVEKSLVCHDWLKNNPRTVHNAIVCDIARLTELDSSNARYLYVPDFMETPIYSINTDYRSKATFINQVMELKTRIEKAKVEDSLIYSHLEKYSAELLKEGINSSLDSSGKILKVDLGINLLVVRGTCENAKIKTNFEIDSLDIMSSPVSIAKLNTFQTQLNKVVKCFSRDITLSVPSDKAEETVEYEVELG